MDVARAQTHYTADRYGGRHFCDTAPINKSAQHFLDYGCADEGCTLTDIHPPLSEQRYVDPSTGGEKGTKLARFDLIPPEAITALAEHFGRGAEKYDDRNWERGYPWSLSFAALQRHIWAFWNGEDVDEETGTAHVIAAMWHCVVLFTFAQRELGTDDRSN